jgi:hypothetical protein
MIHPQAYHWVLLLCCVAIGLIGGIHNLVEGVDYEDCNSRFHHLARVTNFLISSGEVVFSALILLRQFWGIDGLIFCFCLSIVYHLFVLRPAPEAHAVWKWFGASRVMKLWGVFIFIILGVPILLLIWLRPIFTVN